MIYQFNIHTVTSATFETLKSSESENIRCLILIHLSYPDIFEKRMSKDSYMLEHEAFVSNIKGTSVGCVLVCLLHLPIFILLTKLFQGKRKPRIIRDLVFLVLPILATITVLAEYNYWSLLSAICISVLFMNSSDLTYDLNRDHVLVGDSNSPTSSSHAIIYYSTSYITLFKGKIVLHT